MKIKDYPAVYKKSDERESYIEIDEKFINLCPAFEIFDNNCKTFFGSIKVFREYCESLLKITEDDLFQYWKLIRINSNKRIIETVECLIFEEMEKL